MNYKAIDKREVAPYIAQQISSQLQGGKRVLWLLSGGSGGKVCLDAAALLAGQDLSNLFVTMGDERYGELGHSEENFNILSEQGLSLPGATLYRPLTGLPRDETVQAFGSWLQDTLEKVGHVITVTGIGTDGHAYGIKPQSIAVDSGQLAVGFDWDDFERLTITTSFVKKYVDEAIAQAYGADKHPVIKQLLANEGELASFPALVFQQISHATLFSDYQPEKTK